MDAMKGVLCKKIQQSNLSKTIETIADERHGPMKCVPAVSEGLTSRPQQGSPASFNTDLCECDR